MGSKSEANRDTFDCVSDDAFVELECSLCFQIIDCAIDMCNCNGKPAHKECAKAKRYKEQRAKANGEEAVLALQQYQQDHPKEYGYKLHELQNTGMNDRRGKQQRVRVDKFIQEIIAFKRSMLQKPILYLGEKAFKQWYKREEGLDEVEALAKWEWAKKNMKPKMEENIPKYEVAGHTVLMREEGAEVRQVKRSEGDAEDGTKLDRLAQSPLEKFEKDIGVARKKSHDRRRRRSPSSASLSRSRSPSRKKTRRSSPPRKNTSRKRSNSSRRSASSRSRSRSPRRQAPRSNSVASRVSARSRLSLSAGSQGLLSRGSSFMPGERSFSISPVDSKKGHKEDFHEAVNPDQLQDIKNGVLNPGEKIVMDLTSALDVLNGRMQKLEGSDAQEKIEEYEMDEEVTAANTSIDDLKQAMRKVRKAKIAGVQGAVADAKKAQAMATQNLAKIRSLQKVCSNFIADQSKVEKKQQSKVTYRMGKEIQHFRTNGCGMARAKIGSLLMFLSDPQNRSDEQDRIVSTVSLSGLGQSEIKLDAPVLFAADESPIDLVLKSLMPEFESVAVAVKASMLLKQNSGLRGIFQQIVLQDAARDKLMESVDELGEQMVKPSCGLAAGFLPFVDVVRKHTLRVGPTSFPLTGIGNFIFALDKINVCIIQATTLVQKATFETWSQFDDAMEDKKVAKEPWRMAIVEKGETLWVPYGCIPLVCGNEDLNSFIVAPWPVTSLLRAVSEDVVDLLIKGALKIFKKNASNTPWDVVIPAMEKLLQPS